MPSASNSWAREKLASAILDLASASAPSCGSLEQVGGDAVDERGLARLVLADLGVAGDDVRHLVRQHRGELGVVVGERDQAAGDVELAVRQREGVDRGRVEDGDLVFQVRPLGGRDQLVDGLLQHRLQRGGRDRRRHRRRGCAGARAARTAASRRLLLRLRGRRRVGDRRQRSRVEQAGEQQRKRARQRAQSARKPAPASRPNTALFAPHS